MSDTPKQDAYHASKKDSRRDRWRKGTLCSDLRNRVSHSILISANPLLCLVVFLGPVFALDVTPMNRPKRPQALSAAEQDEPVERERQQAEEVEGQSGDPRPNMTTRQGPALSLDLRSLVVSFLRTADRRSVEQASRAWLQAVWNGPPRVVVRHFGAFVRLAALLASYRLDLYPPAKLEFRSAVEPNVELPQVDPLLASAELDFDHINKLELAALVRVVDMSAVTRLSFDFGSAPIQTIAGIVAAAPQLHTLRLCREIDDECPTAIAAALQHVPQLRTLILDYNQIGDAGNSAIAAALQHVPQLDTLSLGNNQIGDAGASAIKAALQHVPQLRTLNLANQQIGDSCSCCCQ